MSAVPTLESEAIGKLCRTHGVSRLVIFGSAVRGDWDPATSDLDFLVEFHPLTPSRFDAYFNLKDGLGSLGDLQALNGTIPVTRTAQGWEGTLDSPEGQISLLITADEVVIERHGSDPFVTSAEITRR